MNVVKATILGLMALLGVSASAVALAQHHHHHGGARFGLFIGGPAFWYGAPYYSPYYSPYYYPRTVVVPGPTTYVEQGQGGDPGPVQQAAPAPGPSYWYYCRESGTYYPYVNECAGPWQRVAPRPPS